MKHKHGCCLIFLIVFFYCPSLIFAEEGKDMSAFDKPPAPFTYYPGIKYTIPTINIIRKSDGAEARFITGKLTFDLMFDLGGIQLDDQGTSLIFLWNSSFFNATDQGRAEVEGIISKSSNTSISGYYSYIAATIIKKSAHKHWANVLDTFGGGIGVGTGSFSGTVKFAAENKYTDSTAITKVSVETFVSWSGIIFIEHNFSRQWIARLSITKIYYNANDYSGSIDEVAFGLSKAFSF